METSAQQVWRDTGSRKLLQKAQMLSTTLHEATFINQLDQWEALIKEHEAISGPMDDDFKIAHLLNNTTGQLNKHLRLHPQTNCEEVPPLIRNYFPAEQPTPTSTATPLDIGAIRTGKKANQLQLQ